MSLTTDEEMKNKQRPTMQRMMTQRVLTTQSTIKNLFLGGHADWKKLQDIEKRRRAILKRHDVPFFRMLLYWDGTVLQALANEQAMWITIAIYILVRVWARIGLPDFVTTLGSVNVATIGSFLVFFLVFHANDAMKRFDHLYRSSMSCEGRIFDVAALARSYLPRERALRLIRYMNAAHIAAYVGLSDTYTYDNFFKPLNLLNYVLTSKELERIEDINMNTGGSAYREIIVWCMIEVEQAQANNLVGEHVASEIRTSILRLRGAVGTMFDLDDQQISFFHGHFAVMISFIFLPIMAISFGLSAGIGDDANIVSDVTGFLLVFLQTFCILGLRVLANMLSDPYGGDLCDLSVMHYINFTWLMSNRMLNAKHTKFNSADLHGEEDIVACSRDIGDAWGKEESMST